VSPARRRPTKRSTKWQRDAAAELRLGCGKLAQAAVQAREGMRDPDDELGVLAEEVIDIATRGLVVTAQVWAMVVGDQELHEKPEPPDLGRRSGSARSNQAGAEVPTVVGLALGGASHREWPATTAQLLEEAVPPLTRAGDALKRHRKEYIEEVTVLREEVIDVEVRIVAADARVASGPRRRPLPGAPKWRERLTRELGGP
jgi:hypothetical protein